MKHQLKWDNGFWVCQNCKIGVVIGVVCIGDWPGSFYVVSDPLYGPDAVALKAKLNSNYNRALYKVMPYEEYLKWYKYNGKELLDQPISVDLSRYCISW